MKTAVLVLCSFVILVVLANRINGCCAPDQFESIPRLYSYIHARCAYLWKEKYALKYSYDYKNKRWAFEQKGNASDSKNIRIIFDQSHGLKFYINGSDCRSAPIGAGEEMRRLCPTENATLHGTYELNVGSKTVQYDTWSHYLTTNPLRLYLKLTKKGCIPIQEGTMGVVMNTWRWEQGEPPCNPWKYPSRTISGDCFKSHVNITKTISSTKTTALMFDIFHTNLKLGVSDKSIYNIPTECQALKEWGDIRMHEILTFMIFRHKYL